MGRLCVADARRQTILSCLDQLADDAFDPFAGFAFTKDHFGKTTSFAALEIDVGISEIRHGREVKALHGQVDAQLSGLHAFQQFAQFARFHLPPWARVEHASLRAQVGDEVARLSSFPRAFILS